MAQEASKNKMLSHPVVVSHPVHEKTGLFLKSDYFKKLYFKNVKMFNMFKNVKSACFSKLSIF